MGESLTSQPSLLGDPRLVEKPVSKNKETTSRVDPDLHTRMHICALGPHRHEEKRREKGRRDRGKGREKQRGLVKKGRKEEMLAR